MSSRELRDLEKEKDFLIERREFAVDFLFCLAAISVLKKLSVHPCPDLLLSFIEDMAFKQFKQKEKYSSGPNAVNGNLIADLFAEVIGVMSQTRFHSVRKKFLAEIKETQTSTIIQKHLIRGMSFIRVKMYPIEEVEEWFGFLKECGMIFIDTRDRDVKHSLCTLFVEILVPVAAVRLLRV
jgi:hypothetical protein